MSQNWSRDSDWERLLAGTDPRFGGPPDLPNQWTEAESRSLGQSTQARPGIARE
jgi:hypothetical protein